MIETLPSLGNHLWILGVSTSDLYKFDAPDYEFVDIYLYRLEMFSCWTHDVSFFTVKSIFSVFFSSEAIKLNFHAGLITSRCDRTKLTLHRTDIWFKECKKTSGKTQLPVIKMITEKYSCK